MNRLAPSRPGGFVAALLTARLRLRRSVVRTSWRALTLGTLALGSLASGIGPARATPSGASASGAGGGGESTTRPEVTADVAAQFYDVRSPTGETILARRRVTTTLGADVYDLYRDKEPGPLGPELSFRTRLRYDADYGASPREADPASLDNYVPGFERGPLDLMYGYIEGRRFLRGWFGFRVGRQYAIDPLGYWSFDGAMVRLTTPYYFAVEALGGLEVRAGFPLSSGRFERDGIWRGNRTGLDPVVYPSFQPSAVAPAMGASIESAGVTFLHGKLTYRRVYNTGNSNTSQFANGLITPVSRDGMRVSSDRIGYSLDATLWNFGGARAGFVHDLFLGEPTSLYGTLEGYIGQKVTIGLDYDYVRPSFDGDSIWNFFASEPLNYLGLRGAVDVTDRVNVAAGAYVRAFQVDTSAINDNPAPNVRPNLGTDPNFYPASGTSFDEGGSVSLRYRTGNLLAGARGSGNFGEGGNRYGGDVYAERVIETRYVVSGRASLFSWEDKLRANRDATSFGYVTGLGYRFAPRSNALVEWQHDMNRIAGHRLRLMFFLNVAVAP